MLIQSKFCSKEAPFPFIFAFGETAMLQHFWGAELSNAPPLVQELTRLPMSRRLPKYVRPPREYCGMFASGSMGLAPESCLECLVLLGIVW